MDKYDFNEELEYCEFRIFNLTREKRRIDKIINTLNNMRTDKRVLFHKLYELEYCLLTLNDKTIVDKDHNEAYDYYLYKLNEINSEMLRVEEEYDVLIKRSVEVNKARKY